MGKYSTKFRSKKGKRNLKINKSRRIKNKHSRRKYRKKTRKRKQKGSRRSINARRPPPYTKAELLDAIRGVFNRSGVSRHGHNPSLDKFVKVKYLLKYVNWLNSMEEFQDKIDEYNENTNLVNIVNMLHESHTEHATYENALDNIIRQLAGLAMRGVPEDQQETYNLDKEEGKDMIDFQNPTHMMIDNYFRHLYPRVERVSYSIDDPVNLPDDWRSILE